MKKSIYITLDIEKLPEGYYVATSRDVQGLVAQAKTFEKPLKLRKMSQSLFCMRKKGVLNKEKLSHIL